MGECQGIIEGEVLPKNSMVLAAGNQFRSMPIPVSLAAWSFRVGKFLPYPLRDKADPDHCR